MKKIVFTIVLASLLNACNSTDIQLTEQTSESTALSNFPPTRTPLFTPEASFTLSIRPTDAEVAGTISQAKLGNNLLPPDEMLPNNVTLQAIGSRTNQEVSEAHVNPSDFLYKLEKWGRVTSYYEEYVDLDRCHSNHKLRAVFFHIVYFQTAQGASESLRDPQWYGDIIEKTSKLGEEAVKSTYRYTNTCNPQENILGITQAFRRLNLLVTINIEAVDENISETAMFKIAQQLGEVTDLKILDAAD